MDFVSRRAYPPVPGSGVFQVQEGAVLDHWGPSAWRTVARYTTLPAAMEHVSRPSNWVERRVWRDPDEVQAALAGEGA